MNIFGRVFTVHSYKQPKWAAYETLLAVNAHLQTIMERLDDLEKRIEATRVRVYQKVKEQDQLKEAEEVIGNRSNSNEEVVFKLPAGTILTPAQILQLYKRD